MSLKGKSAINLGMQAAGQGIGMGLNSLFHNQQMKHQKDFQDLQIEGQRELANYGQALGLDMWNKTNYEAQMKHIKNAGLNPGLMYGSAGQGGSTNTSSAGNVQGGQAPKSTETLGMGIQVASQLALMKAQKENIEADTANKKAEAGVKGVQVPQIQAQTTNTQTDTQLKQSQININKYNAEIARIESEIALDNKSNRIGMLNEAYNNLVANTNLTKEQTKEVQSKVINLGVQNALMQSNILKNKSDIEVNKSKIEQISNEITIAWEQLGINERNAQTNEEAIIQQGIKIFQERIAQEFSMDSEIGRQISHLGSLLLGGMIFKQ